MASQLGGETLSLRNGVRCIADGSTSVEDVLVAIAEQVGGENINSDFENEQSSSSVSETSWFGI